MSPEERVPNYSEQLAELVALGIGRSLLVENVSGETHVLSRVGIYIQNPDIPGRYIILGEQGGGFTCSVDDENYKSLESEYKTPVSYRSEELRPAPLEVFRQQIRGGVKSSIILQSQLQPEEFSRDVEKVIQKSIENIRNSKLRVMNALRALHENTDE